MKRKLLLLGLLFMAGQSLMAEVKVISPNIKSPSSFAIFIDSDSYKAVEPKVAAYRDAVERDGLATYILVDDWASPEAVKDQIAKLYDNKKMPLEGVVFMGDIPIAMLRDAQHLTSAFKMDQENPWNESSVPSDRFYDDFDLKFTFLKQDEENKAYFYYSLDAESTQYVRSDIYSARVRPTGEGANEKLAKFLDKAVAAHDNVNALDKMFVFRGHGYNSDARDAWASEQVALREQLPTLFYGNSNIRFYDFDLKNPVKNYLFEMMGEEDMDFTLFHHHGGEDQQYINGYPTFTGLQSSINYIKSYLRSKVVGTKDPEGNLKHYTEMIGVPESWVDMSDSTRLADEATEKMRDIYLEDIYTHKPNSRFVIFDACSNGSFHYPDCVTNAYIFADGKTVITQGNTVNSLQDRTPDRYLGLLAYGIRIGEWGRYQQTTIETHLVGDPTFRFTNTRDSKIAINAMLAAKGAPNSAWLKMLDYDSPDMQAIAMRRLNDNGYADIQKVLREKFFNSPYGSVRLEAMILMKSKHSEDYVEILKKAVSDNFELVRRLAAGLCADCGDPTLTPYMANSLIEDKLSTRTYYRMRESVYSFEPEAMLAAVNEAIASHPNLVDGTETFDPQNITKHYESTVADFKEGVLDRERSMKRRLSDVSYFRNYNCHYMIPELIKLVEDTTEDPSLRVKAAEALGWFAESYRYAEIEDMCDRVIAANGNASVVNECRKTKARLSTY